MKRGCYLAASGFIIAGLMNSGVHAGSKTKSTLTSGLIAKTLVLL